MTVEQLIRKTEQWTSLAKRLEKEVEEQGTDSYISIPAKDVEAAVVAVNLLKTLVYSTDVNIQGW